MRTRPTISAKAISDEIGMVPRNVQRHINSLKKAGLIKRVGAAKGGRWQILNISPQNNTLTS